jgi:hypothetical protein
VRSTWCLFRVRFSLINKVATTHCSFLRLQIKREGIIDKCRECERDSRALFLAWRDMEGALPMLACWQINVKAGARRETCEETFYDAY